MVGSLCLQISRVVSFIYLQISVGVVFHISALHFSFSCFSSCFAAIVYSIPPNEQFKHMQK